MKRHLMSCTEVVTKIATNEDVFELLVAELAGSPGSNEI